MTAPAGYNLPNDNANQGIVFSVYQSDNGKSDVKAYFGTVTGSSAFGYLDGNYVVNEPSQYGWARLIKRAENTGTPVNGSFETSFAGTTYVVTDYGETMHYLLVSVSYTNLSEKEQDISKRNIGLYLDNEEIFSVEYRQEFKGVFLRQRQGGNEC